MRKAWKTTLIMILIALLLLSNAYFTIKAQQPDYKILIGKPTSDTAVDYTRSSPLRNMDEINTVLFSLINASSVEKPEVSNNTADAVIQIGIPSDETVYFYSLWTEDDYVILSIGSEYKQIDDAYYVSELKALIESQLSFYK